MSWWPPLSPARPTGTGAPRSSWPPRRTCRSRGRRGVAGDETVIALIDRLPREHRQPSLVFSVARWLGAPAGGVAGVPGVPRRGVAAHRGGRPRAAHPDQRGRQVRAAARRPRPHRRADRAARAGGVGRAVPRRRRLLLPLRRRAGHRRRRAAARVPDERRRAAPTRLPEIVWRRGIDLAPLRRPAPNGRDDVAWLEALLPPDRPERLARLRAACATLAADPPEVVAGDAVARCPRSRRPPHPAPRS